MTSNNLNEQNHIKSNDFANLIMFLKLALLLSFPGIIIVAIGYLTIDGDNWVIGMGVSTFAMLFFIVSACTLLSAIVAELIFYKKSIPKKFISTIIGAVLIWQIIKSYSSIF